MSDQNSNHLYTQPLYYPIPSEDHESDQPFYLFPPCIIPVAPESMIFHTSSRAVSRFYTPESSYQPTILTAVPTADPQGGLEPSNQKRKLKDDWDGNPETFSHPLLRIYSPN